MDPLSEQRPYQIGDEVCGADDHKIGTIEAIGPTHLVVEKGLLLKEQLYIPLEAVNNCSAGKVYLGVTKDEVKAQGWDQPPVLPTEADGRPVDGLLPD
jgi:hypothetical protein